MTKPEDTATDIRYIKNHMLWPNMALPLKRFVPSDAGGSGSREFAYMLNGSDYTDGKPELRKGNMFNMKETDEKVVYDSPEAVIAAGWVVD